MEEGVPYRGSYRRPPVLPPLAGGSGEGPPLDRAADPSMDENIVATGFTAPYSESTDVNSNLSMYLPIYPTNSFIQPPAEQLKCDSTRAFLKFLQIPNFRECMKLAVLILGSEKEIEVMCDMWCSIALRLK